MRTTLCFYVLILGFLNEFSSLSQSIWTGDTEQFNFEANQISSRFDENESTSTLKMDTVLTGDCTWEFRLSYGFNPSSSNYSTFFIAGDQSATDQQNGYFLKVGAQNDALQFFAIRNGEKTLLVQGIEERLNFSKVDMDMRITRSKSGTWQLLSKLADEPDFQLEGEITDTGFVTFYAFEWQCHYTKTRVDKFALSNITIKGEKYEDTLPPQLLKVDVLDANTVQFTFSENIYARKENFDFKNPSVEIDSVSTIGNVVKLTLTHALTADKSVSLSLIEIKDWADNKMPHHELEVTFHPFTLARAFALNNQSIYVQFNKIPTTENLMDNFTYNNQQPIDFKIIEGQPNSVELRFQTPFKPDNFTPLHIQNLGNTSTLDKLDTTTILAFHAMQRGDLVINEIMADPTPPVHLPEVEYVELYNTSNYTIAYHQISLFIQQNDFHFSDYEVIEPGEYLLVVNADDAHAFQDYVNLTSPNKTFTLNNSGFEVWIDNANGNVVDYYHYQPDILFSEFKQSGGWSAERMDFDNPGNQKNWGASTHENGGTPGFENSILAFKMDNSAPSISQVAHPNDTTLVLFFDETMDIQTLEKLDNYTISNISTHSVFPGYPSYKWVEIHFAEPLQPATSYQLEVQYLTDLSGNELSPFTYSFELPTEVAPNNAIFNELMFDPLNDCPEYIELYNRSAKFLDLSELVFSEVKGETLAEGIPVSPESILFPPRTYLLCTADKAQLRHCYQVPDEALIVEIDNWPNLNNEGQTIALLNRSGLEIDKLAFNEKWHSSLVKNTKGVALERVDFDVPTNNPNSWTSAASTTNYATPGKPNSQQISINAPSREIRLEHENISPDNDGYNDELKMLIPEKYAGYSVSIQIFDTEGRLMKDVYNNYFLGTQNTLYISHFNRDQFPSGIYGLRIRGIHPNGHTFEKILPFVLSFK